MLGGALIVGLAGLINAWVWWLHDRKHDPEAGFFSRGRSWDTWHGWESRVTFWVLVVMGTAFVVVGACEVAGLTDSR
jgi:hypothetical protein